MVRRVIYMICFVAAQGMLLAADDVTGSWEGSFQTQEGAAGALTAEVSALPDGGYKAVVSAPEQGVQFELTGKKQEEKVILSGTINVSPEVGSLEIQAEIAEGKFSGTFKGTTYSGTFQMKRLEKKPAQ